MSMSLGRAAVIDYLGMVPVTFSRYEFLLQSGDQVMPGLTSELFQSLLRPLASDVWILLCQYTPLCFGSATAVSHRLWPILVSVTTIDRVQGIRIKIMSPDTRTSAQTSR